jgi:hypothetical protein
MGSFPSVGVAVPVAFSFEEESSGKCAQNGGSTTRELAVCTRARNSAYCLNESGLVVFYRLQFCGFIPSTRFAAVGS